jgi:uncharacterized protein
MDRLSKYLFSRHCRISIIILVAPLYCFAMRDAASQSFNCHKAGTADEVTIRSSARLSALDQQLSSLFFKMRSSLTNTAQR